MKGFNKLSSICNKQTGDNLKQHFFFKFCFVILLLVCFFTQNFIISKNNELITACSSVGNTELSAGYPRLKDLFIDFFGGGRKDSKKDDRQVWVYPGGFPLGFVMECSGVVIVAIGSVESDLGEVKPVENKNIKVGDIIRSANGKSISCVNDLHKITNENNGDIEVEIKRDNFTFKEKIQAVKELSTGEYRLGLWVRDNAAGVGTLTYIRQDSSRFGALGHPVCEIDTGKVMPISSGSVYKSSIVGCNKGRRGVPGELRGLFLRKGIIAGTLDNNNEFGVYGQMGEDYVKSLNIKPMQVGFRNTVKTGKAKILCTIDGNTPEEYEIEIIKASYQTKQDNKSMVIKVTDNRLIEQTGGIVQGMSGSPIIQNGKIVGAVTHVFVSDPTKGFGVYIDWMIDN